MLLVGSHVSLKAPDYFLGAVKEALSYGASTLMVYTGAPQNTIRKNLDDLKIDEALRLMQTNDISPSNVIVHAPYIINLANPDFNKRAFAIDFLTKEVLRTFAMHAKVIVIHPGSAVGLDRQQAIKWIAEGINQVIGNTKETDVVIALETMAGKGNEVGQTFNELAQIINVINDKIRVGVCFDTCHVYDSGYDIVNQYDEVMHDFNELVGLNRIKVIHINDSKNSLGSRKDRHANLGTGTINLATFSKIINDNRFENIPKILETPYVAGQPPYLTEIKLLKSMKI